MLEIIKHLLVLQEKDQRIKTLQTEIDNIPSEKVALEAKLKDIASTAEATHKESLENELERKKLQAEAQTKRDAITRYRQQQLQTKKNEEYSALNNEIEKAEQAVIAIEDRELSLMEHYEALKPAVVQANANLEKERITVKERIDEIGSRQRNIEERISTLQTERTQQASLIEEDVLSRYDRLFRSKDGVAVAPMERGVCQGCFMKGTTQTLVDLKAEREIISCPQCGRIIYYTE